MDIAGISTAGLVNNTSNSASVQSEAAVSVLKSVLETQGQNALKLIESVPAPAKTTSSNGSVGGNVNTYA